MRIYVAKGNITPIPVYTVPLVCKLGFLISYNNAFSIDQYGHAV